MNFLEGHKLHYHPERVAAWYRGETIYPLYVEIGPSSICNHRCLMCGYDYLDHSFGKLPPEVMNGLIDQLSELGVRSLCFSGDGEPMLNKGLVQSVLKAHDLGIDVGLSTNGTLLTAEIAKKLLPALTWIRFSINGGTRESYARVHQTKESDFDRVIEAIKTASEIKSLTDSKVTIGVQFIFLPENYQTVLDLATLVKKSGADYFVVKPFYQHTNNQYTIPSTFNISNHREYLGKVENLNNENFVSIIRWYTSEEVSPIRKYKKCFGLPFIGIVSASGDVFPCLPHQDIKLHSFGNIKNESFQRIWNGERRKKVMAYIDSIDKNSCQPYCRHHAINNYLWEIRNPGLHNNFI